MRVGVVAQPSFKLYPMEARDPHSSPRLVHRRLRYARSERGEGAARRAADLTTNFETASKLKSGCISLYHGIDGGCARRANGADLGTLGDDLCFPCRGANGCIDSWDACPVVGTGEVTASSNTAKQRFADISPNCASKAKSMTPSGKIATKSPRCRIASRSTLQGENVPKFQ
jgi:hypothetical protein